MVSLNTFSHAMASKYPESPSRPRKDRIHQLDKISCDNGLVRQIPVGRLAVTLLLVTMCYTDDHSGDHNTLLYHCVMDNQRRTFIKQRWEHFGLDDLEQERECVELRGISLIQGLITPDHYAVVYVLTADGVVYSFGYTCAQLGRSTRRVPAIMFGEVPITEPILAMACGSSHCLAMSASKVFAFGHNNEGQAGVPRTSHVLEPTAIYAGIGGRSPIQVSAGDYHSAILTSGGQVLVFGNGEYGELGHGCKIFQNFDHPRIMKSLKTKIDQIGCTWRATFFLADGKIFGCGYNEDSSLGVGHNKGVKTPTRIKTGRHVITSFRCSHSLVVAITQLHDILVWGRCHDKVIEVPRLEKLEFPGIFSAEDHRKTPEVLSIQYVYTLYNIGAEKRFKNTFANARLIICRFRESSRIF